ncbi:hypothetical protein OLMES_3493 [Oleiphilus messinensis]|uniref:Uncharacterized protein n=1 Tax=Oleiphilus messinensis TaxID=141451 RepID=A0A1Y0IAJ7_9GAMM|nr:hypothetical protein OLMES_3493 [Oleiphilus messinensis]
MAQMYKESRFVSSPKWVNLGDAIHKVVYKLSHNVKLR